MEAVAVIAGLTFMEAVRRRFVYAGLVVCALFFAIALMPFHQRHHHFFPMSPLLIGQSIESQGAHIAEFFAFLFAIALSSGTISSELEKGVLSVILPKPIGRWSVYVGKWVGINLFVLIFLAIWTAITQFAIYNHLHYSLPSLWKAYFAMALYPLVFSAVSLFFSSMSSSTMAMTMPLILSSVAWTEGFLRNTGNQLDVSSLKIAADVAAWAAPLDPLHRLVERLLNTDELNQMMSYFSQSAPAAPPPVWTDIAWIVGYGLAALVGGMFVFQKRDV